MVKKARAVRFSREEETLIQEFLEKNTFFDFSSLARASILNFIQNPVMNITPVQKQSYKNKKNKTNRDLNIH